MTSCSPLVQMWIFQSKYLSDCFFKNEPLIIEQMLHHVALFLLRLIATYYLDPSHPLLLRFHSICVLSLVWELDIDSRFQSEELVMDGEMNLRYLTLFSQYIECWRISMYDVLAV